MRYTVVWTPAATDQLADLWVGASDRQAVTDAADRLELALRDDPDTKAHPFGRFYVLTDDPLAVLFEILPDDCLVRVVQVRRTT
ncbi:MAG: hypothetical protein L0Z62_41165 [Gemmataceae bacterium]|nr:hypothetical protein [Gemmataceae bacterium]